MDTNAVNKPRDVLEALLSHLGVDAHISEAPAVHDESVTRFAIQTREPQLLLGTEGKNLFALSHVVKKICEQQAVKSGTAYPQPFIVDVNDFQEKRIQELRARSDVMAERARYFKSSIELPPMNPYERMLIHSFFTKTPDIRTESTGYGKERRVVLEYQNPNNTKT